jgi:protein-tyrosine phosphatase
MRYLNYILHITILILLTDSITYAQEEICKDLKCQCEAVAYLSPNLKNPLLVFDILKPTYLPRNFRTSNSTFLQTLKTLPTRNGLDRLWASASAQFSEKNLRIALPYMQGQVYVVDLRRESHGFLGGQPISWYARENFSNTGKTITEIGQIEYALLKQLSTRKVLCVSNIIEKINGSISNILKCQVPLQQLETEEQLVKRLGLQYVRFLVSDHHIPEDNIVDDFLKFIESLPPKTWLHFHCRGGRGRSSIFLAMLDIIHNGFDLSLDTILERQFLLGSVNLRKFPITSGKKWKLKKLKTRVIFMREFYNYIRDPQGFTKVTWSVWKKQQKLGI